MPNWNRELNQSRFRRIVFREGKVLQSREMNLLQDLERYVPGLTTTRLAKYDLDALFRPGALINARVEILNQTQVRISREVPDLPVLVFAAGAFEPVDSPVTFTYSVKGSGTPEKVYVNWVLWKVSADQDDPNALYDPTLLDLNSGEPAANIGQIEVYLTPESDHGPVDPRMYSRNQEPVPCVHLEWQGGALRILSVTRFTGTLNATQDAAGMVRLSQPGTDVAAAANDPRLSDARQPLAGSVSTGSVQPVQQSSTPSQIAYTDETGSQSHDVVYPVLSGGVSSDRLVFSGWTATLTETINKILGRIGRLFDAVRNLRQRVADLESRPQVNLSAHVGQPLGLAESHPPRASGVPFEALTDGNASSRAFVVAQGQNVLSAITGDGNFQLLGSGYNDLVGSVGSESIDFRSFAALARRMLNHLQNHPTGGGSLPSSLGGDVSGPLNATVVSRIRGRPVNIPSSTEPPPQQSMMLVLEPSGFITLASIPSGGSGVSNLGGDVAGPPTSNTVIRIQGRPVAEDVPQEGQVLSFQNNMWRPFTFSIAPQPLSFQALIQKSNGTQYYRDWIGFQLGNLQVLYLGGDFQHGDLIFPPRDNPAAPNSPMSWGSTSHTVAFSVVSDFSSMPNIGRHCRLLDGGGSFPYRVDILVYNAPDQFAVDTVRQSHWVNVAIFCVKVVN